MSEGFSLTGSTDRTHWALTDGVTAGHHCRVVIARDRGANTKIQLRAQWRG